MTFEDVQFQSTDYAAPPPVSSGAELVRRATASSEPPWIPEARLEAVPVQRRLRHALTMSIAIALHVIAVAAFLQMRNDDRSRNEPAPIMASIVDAAPAELPPPPMPPVQMQPVPIDPLVPPAISIEVETITLAEKPATPVSAVGTTIAAAPPMIESVEYVRPPAPVYPSESNRKRERGTVVLRVLVDAQGRPAQIRVEHSSGYARLDQAARSAVEKALFRPHEVDGVAQSAQVLIPIEFTRHAT